MLEVIMLFAAFCGGIGFGRAQAVNKDITSHTEHMQQLIDQAYEKRDHMKRMWLDAEEKSVTWERRYWNLWQSQEEEEKVGS
jgi:hypothetical protein